MTARAFPRLLLAACLVAALPGCGWFDEEERLEGQRIPIRSDTDSAGAADAPGAGPSLGFGGTGAGAGLGSVGFDGAQGQGVPLPSPRRIDDWPQTNAAPSHNAGHLSGPVSLARAWTADAGSGDSDDGRITSAPVVAGGTVFTLDAEAQLTAFSAGSGERRWRVSLAPGDEDGDEGFGGGLAVAGGRVFATTGFGEVVALEAASGAEVWRRGVNAAIRAAPAVDRGVVVAVTRDNNAFGLDAATGEVLWRAPAATSDEAGFLGGASPAIAGGLALLPFTSGELVAVEARTGRRAWTAVLGGGRRGLARSSISDVTGDPVVVGPLVIAANQSGRIVAIDGRTGQRVWTRSVGSTGPLWAAGETVFLVTDSQRLMRLAAANGTTIWSTPLEAFEDPEDREDPIGYSGPVLVEGRVLVTSSLGELLAFEGVGGREVARTELTGGSLLGPVVAGDTLFVLTGEGTLEAYR